MEESLFLQGMFIAFGVILVIASIFNWGYFFKRGKAHLLAKSIGLTKTRVIYGILGVLFTLVGLNYYLKLGWF